MKAGTLDTGIPELSLVEPDVKRDAPISVKWLQGNSGHQTLKLMGVNDKDDKPPLLKDEEQRITEFVEKTDQLNWMLKYRDKIVGSVWVDLVERNGTPAPSFHIMIGDPTVRGKGLGLASAKAVIYYLKHKGTQQIHSRHLKDNVVASKLLVDLGFQPSGKLYEDDDGLNWQNVSLKLS